MFRKGLRDPSAERKINSGKTGSKYIDKYLYVLYNPNIDNYLYEKAH